MRGDKKHQVKVRLTETQYSQIVELSRQSEVSVSNILRYFIDLGLNSKLPNGWRNNQQGVENNETLGVN